MSSFFLFNTGDLFFDVLSMTSCWKWLRPDDMMDGWCSTKINWVTSTKQVALRDVVHTQSEDSLFQ